MVINHNPSIRDPSIKTKECAAGLMFTEKVAGGLVDYPKIIVARRQPPEKQEFQRNKNFKLMLLLHEIPKLQGNSIFNV